MSGFFQTCPTFIEYIAFCLHLLNEVLADCKQIKSYTRSTMDEIRLSDLSMLNIEKELSENLDFISVVDIFAKMKTRRKQLVYTTRPMCHVSTIKYCNMPIIISNCCIIKYVIINVCKIYF